MRQRASWAVAVAVAVAFAAWASVVPPAQAADPEGRFAVIGVGRAACSAFTEARRASPEAFRQFGGWISGYLTGLNEATPDTFDLSLFEDADTLGLYVARYCEQNPKDAFVVAVKTVASALAETRLTRAEDLVSVGESPSVLLYESALAAVEAQLRALGHLSGKAPAPEAELRAALRAFQREAGLGESGLPDQPTLVRLLRGGDDQGGAGSGGG